ncbi:MAG: hypothetical protein K6G23_03370 [Lachnospiraceae bacterium]|nr:hypothetical protein [Lachnospiraceae bacterium]
MSLQGVYTATKKDGTIYYRASITHDRKHISLGSYKTEEKAHKAYLTANAILEGKDYVIASYRKTCALSFEKYVSMINLRDNRMYFSNPIYLEKNYFSYYFGPEDSLKFSIDDLFYYSSHKIMRRGSHLFVADYGSQISILSRYGIKNYAIVNKDYEFINGDHTDLRYENIHVNNPYYGITYEKDASEDAPFTAHIHIRGYTIIGRYDSAIEAAIAYNKAVDILKKRGSSKNYPVNYIEELSPSAYANLYARLPVSKALKSVALN